MEAEIPPLKRPGPTGESASPPMEKLEVDLKKVSSAKVEEPVIGPAEEGVEAEAAPVPAPEAAPEEEKPIDIKEATGKKPSPSVAEAHTKYRFTQTELSALLTKSGRWRQGASLEAAVGKILEQRRLRLPTPIPPDITASQIEDLITSFAHNQRLIVGGAGITGLAETELMRVIRRLEGIDRGKAKFKEELEKYGKPGWLKEAQAVARARSELRTAKDAKRAWERQRKLITKKANITEGELDLFQRFYSIDETLAGEKVAVDRVREVAEQAGFTWTWGESVDDFRAFFTNNLAFQPRYSTYKALREQDAIPQLESASSIDGRVSEAQTKLEEADKKAKALQKAQETSRAKLPSVEKRLDEWADQLDRIGRFVLEQYIPEAQEVSTALANLEETQATLAKRENQLADPEEAAFIGERKLRKAIETLQKTTHKQRETLADLTDPRRRLAQCKDLARGLELVDQEDLDPATLSHRDKFQLAVVQTLLGMPVTADLSPAPAVTRAEPAEKPPSEAPPTEEPPAAQERVLSQLPAEELNAMPTKELAVVASQLTPEQVGGLSPQKIVELAQGGHLTPEQLVGLPEDTEVEAVNSELAAEDPQTAERILTASVEAADKSEEGIARETELPRVITDALRNAMDVVREHLPEDHANQPISLGEAQKELAKLEASEDAETSSKASQALKFLGIAIVGMTLMSTGKSHEA